MKLPVWMSYEQLAQHERSHEESTRRHRSPLYAALAAAGVVGFLLGAAARVRGPSDTHLLNPLNLIGSRRPGRFPGLSHDVADLPSRPVPLPWFDSLRVITLPSRPERRAHMEQLDAFLGLGFTYEEAVGIDDPRVPERVERWNVTKGWSQKADARQQACRLSHTQAIMAGEEADEETTLILEDDVDFELNFRVLAGTILRDVPDDWDIIFFGHTNLPGLTEYRVGLEVDAHNPRIFVSVAPRGGHAYALSRKGRKLFLSMLSDDHPERADTDGGFAIDQYFDIMASTHIGKLYTVLPDIVVQVSGFESDLDPGQFGHDDYHDKPLVDPARPLAKAYAETKAKAAVTLDARQRRVRSKRHWLHRRRTG